MDHFEHGLEVKLYAITRHKIEGMSDINLLYTRPSIDDLREIIEYLN